MSNTFKWCGKIAPKASIPELVQNMCAFLSGDGLKTLINNTVKEYLDANPIKGFDVDKVFPIGSIYATENKDFDPVKEWGGSWEKLPELSALRNYGETDEFITDIASNGVVSRGTIKFEPGVFSAGKQVQKLSYKNIPRHKHTLNDIYYSVTSQRQKFKVTSSTSGQSLVVSVTGKKTEQQSSTDYYSDATSLPTTERIPIHLIDTPTYGVIYWRRIA